MYAVLYIQHVKRTNWIYGLLFRYCGYIEDDQKDLQEDAHRDAMLLFASNTGIFLLQSAEDLFIDGTFFVSVKSVLQSTCSVFLFPVQLSVYAIVIGV